MVAAAWLGDIAVLAAIVGAAILAFEGLSAVRSGSATDRRRLAWGVALLVGGAGVAFVAIELALLTDDFRLAYVARNHATTTPLLFTIATAWASLEGSIVLWGLVLAGYVAVVARSLGPEDRSGEVALGVMGLVSLFFFGLMATVADPFQVCTEATAGACLASSPFPWVTAAAPLDGPGPNPLLQNHILMAVHPPMLYLGYVGMTVPFAFAMAALLLRRPGAGWLRRTRRATLVAWSFLTLGIVLGGWWSYEVLGWGGYWAWDPVENASFIPWLVATAFLHSAVVQARRGVLQAWNFVLVISTFALTILGTFLTRSGVIASVHSFTQSAIGPALLGFLAVVLVASFAVFAARAHLVASSPRLDSLASREGVFLLNNLLLALFAFVVLTGTLFPLLVEAFQGAQVGVGRPFFDRMAIPISFALLLAMGIGPITPYRVARPAVLWERIRLPLQFALAVGAVAVLTGFRNGWLILALVCGSFVIAVVARHAWTTARSRTASWREVPSAFGRLVRRDPHYWGGQLSHVGVALVAIAIAASANLATRATVELTPGDTANFAGLEVTYRAPFSRLEANRTVVGVRLEVRRDGRLLGSPAPRLNEYPNQVQAIVTPSVVTRWDGDVYTSIRRFDPASGVVELQLIRYPLQWLLWVAGLLVAAGGLVPVWLDRRRTSHDRVPDGAEARS